MKKGHIFRFINRNPVKMTVDCPICLSPLSSPIGVCAPCGHPFHPDCYDRWFAQSSSAEIDRSNGRETRAKCPSCNAYVDSFAQNVFLGFEEGLDFGSDEDSFSSLDEEDGIKDVETCNAASTSCNTNVDPVALYRSPSMSSSSTSSIPISSSATGNCSPRNDVICIDDADVGICTQIQALSPCAAAPGTAGTTRTKKKRKRKNNDAKEGEVDKWKVRAKNYRRRVRQLEAQSSERNEAHGRITSMLRQVEDRKKEIERERDSIRDSVQEHERNMQTLELDLARSRRQVRELEEGLAAISSESKRLESERAKLKTTMQQVKEKHAQDIERAQLEGMAEVQELRNERPKMLEELRYLKEQLNKARTLRDSIGSAGQKSSNSQHAHLHNAAANAARFAREMRLAKDKSNEKDRRETKQQKDLEQKARLSRKVSGQAARMARAAKAKMIPAQSSASHSLLRSSSSIISSGRRSTFSSAGSNASTTLRRHSPTNFRVGNASRQHSRGSESTASSSNSNRSNNTRGLILVGDANNTRGGIPSLSRSSANTSSNDNRRTTTTSSSSGMFASSSLATGTPSFPFAGRKRTNDIRQMLMKRK